jgi:hypothetical protein
MSRQPPGKRADYRWFHSITTRWMDNDALQRGSQKPVPIPPEARGKLALIAVEHHGS